MLEKYDTVTISEHFVCPLEYGDFSGLEVAEIVLLNIWIADHVKPCTVFDYSDETSFARCDITGLMSTCFDASLFADSGV